MGKKVKYISIPEENIEQHIDNIADYPVWNDHGHYLFTKDGDNIIIKGPAGSKDIVLSNKPYLHRKQVAHQSLEIKDDTKKI